MKIKVDENLGRPHVALLKRHGYEADRLFDEDLSGIVRKGVKSFIDSPASSHGRESGKLYFIGGKTCEGRVLTKTINSQQKI